MSTVTTILLWLLIIPSLLVVIIPLIDKILNVWFIDYFTQSLEPLNNLIWSNQTNYILIIIWLIMFLAVFRFIFRSISVFGK